jgi:hypothetical protein
MCKKDCIWFWQDSENEGEEEGGSSSSWREAATTTKQLIPPRRDSSSSVIIPPRRDSSPSVRSAAESARSAESFPHCWTDEENSPQVSIFFIYIYTNIGVIVLKALIRSLILSGSANVSTVVGKNQFFNFSALNTMYLKSVFVSYRLRRARLVHLVQPPSGSIFLLFSISGSGSGNTANR